jgi:hypothetical protein
MRVPHISDFYSTQPVIRCELTDSDTASACGLVARSSSPLLLLCRKLVEAGHPPGTPLTAWRGDVECLRVRSIGEAALLRVNPKGTGFIKQALGVPTGPPIAAADGGAP